MNMISRVNARDRLAAALAQLRAAAGAKRLSEARAVAHWAARQQDKLGEVFLTWASYTAALQATAHDDAFLSPRSGRVSCL